MKQNTRVIAFGDIHGCYKAAVSAIELTRKENARAIFLGDYVDRGPDSIKTMEILIEAKKNNPDWIFLRGNHDQMLLDLILGVTEPHTEFNVPNGLSSNEETTKVFFEWETCTEIFKKEISSFLINTVFYYEIEEWIFVHAPLKDSNIPLDKKLEEELIWSYALSPVWEGKSFVHGHATVKSVTVANKGTNINTECGYGGVLTGVLIDAEKNEILNTYSIKENGLLIK